MMSIQTSQQPLFIHPDDYGPIQALNQQRPTQNDPRLVTILVQITEPAAGRREKAVQFDWRDDIHCWHSQQMLFTCQANAPTESAGAFACQVNNLFMR